MTVVIPDFGAYIAQYRHEDTVPITAKGANLQLAIKRVANYLVLIDYAEVLRHHPDFPYAQWKAEYEALRDSHWAIIKTANAKYVELVQAGEDMAADYRSGLYQQQLAYSTAIRQMLIRLTS